MLLVIFLCKVQKNLHIIADIFSLFPYKADSHPDGRLQRDPNDARKMLRHTGIKKTGILVGLQKLDRRIDLTAPHNDMGLIALLIKSNLEKLILDGIPVKKDQLLFCHIRDRDAVPAGQAVLFSDTEDDLIIRQNHLLKFVDVVLLHIDQGEIEGVILHQLAGTDGAVFLQNHRNIRMLLPEGIQKLREKDDAEHGRNSDAKRRLYAGCAEAVGLQLGTVLENISGFLVERFPLLRQDQVIALPVKEADTEFDLQLPDSHGDRRLGHI